MRHSKYRARLVRKTRKFIRSAVDRVSFAADPFGTKLSLARQRLWVSIQVVGVDTHEAAAVSFGSVFPTCLLSEDEAIEWICVCVRSAWIHELNEMLCVDGRRRRDLHDDRGSTIAPPEDEILGNLRVFKARLDTFLRDARQIVAAL